MNSEILLGVGMFTVIVLSLGAGSEAGGVVGVVMICLGMAYPPVKSFAVKKKK